MTRWRLAVLGVILIVLLGVLAAGLSGAQFRGGRLPWGTPPDEPGSPGGAVPLGNMSWLIYLIWVLFFIALAIALVDPKLRRKLLLGLLVFVAMLIALGLLGERLRLPESAPVEEDPGPAAVLPFPTQVSPSGDDEAPSPGRSPGWVAYLGAAAIAAATAWWVLRRLRPRSPEEGEEIRDALAEASADLAAGLPVSDVVVRCWTRMVAVLTQHMQGVNRPAVTPREIADQLTRLGLGEESVLVLTKLFEEVRYGHKDSEPRRAEALAALAAIERAYG